MPYAVGQELRIKPPFDDGLVHVVTAAMACNANGEQVEANDPAVAFWQYELDGVFYAENHVEAV